MQMINRLGDRVVPLVFVIVTFVIAALFQVSMEGKAARGECIMTRDYTYVGRGVAGTMMGYKYVTRCVDVTHQ